MYEFVNRTKPPYMTIRHAQIKGNNHRVWINN